MKMMFKRDDSAFMSEINVTPFVDVMLVLLIIFMVTAPMMTQGVTVSLPEISSASPLVMEEKPLIISMKSDKIIYINDEKVPFVSFRKHLSAILKERADRDVFLKADKKIPYGAVVHLMSEIHVAGVKNLGIVALSTEEKVKNIKKQTKNR
jgi:biopolymer transport protein TolR